MRVAPEEDELGGGGVRVAAFGGRVVGGVVVDVDVWVEVPDAGADGARDELAVPPTCDLVGDVALFVRDVARDLERVASAPSTRLECENALVSCSVIRDLPSIPRQSFLLH